MTISRRHLLKVGLAVAASVSSGASLAALVKAQSHDGNSINSAMRGAYQAVHDPSIIRDGDMYYLFCTGPGITLRTSPDLIEWELRGDVFPAVPEWALANIPAATNIWAPDISYFNDLYHLYYSVSTFGSSRSRIGLATTPTLDLDSPDYAWTDHGLVIASERDSDWNAIDPNLAQDADGNFWIAWGSYWSGIKMRRIDMQTGLLSSEDDELYALASRPEAPRAVEAPFIISRDGFYYLFVSFDRCCAATSSTYNVRVGRSETISGPYVDADGLAMIDGGGTLVLEGNVRWRGPGHNAVLREGEQDWLVYHAYDATLGGLPTLRISPIVWDADGWPTASL